MAQSLQNALWQEIYVLTEEDVFKIVRSSLCTAIALWVNLSQVKSCVE